MNRKNLRGTNKTSLILFLWGQGFYYSLSTISCFRHLGNASSAEVLKKNLLEGRRSPRPADQQREVGSTARQQRWA